MADQLMLDNKESFFFTRELEHIKAKTYDTKYKVLKAAQLLPVDTSAAPEDAIITFRRFTKVGFSKVIAHYANDAPRVDGYGTEESVKIKRIGNSFGFDNLEIKKARKTGRPLPPLLARTARRATEEKINSIAWNGDTPYNLQGFIDYPGITEYTVPVGASTSKLWSTKTPDELLADLNNIVTAVIDSTNGVEVPDTLILPIAQYELIKNTRVTDGDDSILKYFLENNFHIKQVEWLTELKGAGAGGTDRYMVYTKDSDHVTLEIPQPFTLLPPQAQGYGQEILTEAFTAGVIVYFPLSVAFGDGI